jgi:hypothetical protein
LNFLVNTAIWYTTVTEYVVRKIISGILKQFYWNIIVLWHLRSNILPETAYFEILLYSYIWRSLSAWKDGRAANCELRNRPCRCSGPRSVPLRGYGRIGHTESQSPFVRIVGSPVLFNISSQNIHCMKNSVYYIFMARCAMSFFIGMKGKKV